MSPTFSFNVDLIVLFGTFCLGGGWTSPQEIKHFLCLLRCICHVVICAFLIFVWYMCCRTFRMKQCSSLPRTVHAYTICVCQAALTWLTHRLLFLHSTATCWAPLRWLAVHSSQTLASKLLPGWVQDIWTDTDHNRVKNY